MGSVLQFPLVLVKIVELLILYPAGLLLFAGVPREINCRVIDTILLHFKFYGLDDVNVP